MSVCLAKQSLLPIACIVIAACSPSTHSIGEGPVSLKHSGRLDSGHQFELSNGTPDVIAFRGWPKAFSDPTPSPSAFALSCRSDSSSTVSGFGFEDGRKPKLVEVPSRQRMNLVIPNYSTTNSAGNICQLHLKLENGSLVESDEFTL